MLRRCQGSGLIINEFGGPLTLTAAACTSQGRVRVSWFLDDSRTMDRAYTTEALMVARKVTSQTGSERLCDITQLGEMMSASPASNSRCFETLSLVRRAGIGRKSNEEQQTSAKRGGKTIDPMGDARVRAACISQPRPEEWKPSRSPALADETGDDVCGGGKRGKQARERYSRKPEVTYEHNDLDHRRWSRRGPIASRSALHGPPVRLRLCAKLAAGRGADREKMRIGMALDLRRDNVTST